LQSVEPRYVFYDDQRELYLTGAVIIELIEAVFAKNALFRFKAKGFSMSPFIRDGDIITLSPASLSPISLGKPVACVCPVRERLLVHRIVGRKGNYYVIKGDNASRPDCAVDKKRILGCVTAIERKGRPIFLGLGPERVIISFLSRIGVLYFVFFLWRISPGSFRRFIKCRILL
jgi:hypothetical protein